MAKKTAALLLLALIILAPRARAGEAQIPEAQATAPCPELEEALGHLVAGRYEEMGAVLTDSTVARFQRSPAELARLREQLVIMFREKKGRVSQLSLLLDQVYFDQFGARLYLVRYPDSCFLVLCHLYRVGDQWRQVDFVVTGSEQVLAWLCRSRPCREFTETQIPGLEAAQKRLAAGDLEGAEIELQQNTAPWSRARWNDLDHILPYQDFRQLLDRGGPLESVRPLFAQDLGGGLRREAYLWQFGSLPICAEFLFAPGEDHPALERRFTDTLSLLRPGRTRTPAPEVPVVTELLAALGEGRFADAAGDLCRQTVSFTLLAEHEVAERRESLVQVFTQTGTLREPIRFCHFTRPDRYSEQWYCLVFENTRLFLCLNLFRRGEDWVLNSWALATQLEELSPIVPYLPRSPLAESLVPEMNRAFACLAAGDIEEMARHYTAAKAQPPGPELTAGLRQHFQSLVDRLGPPAAITPLFSQELESPAIREVIALRFRELGLVHVQRAVRLGGRWSLLDGVASAEYYRLHAPAPPATPAP